MRKQQEKTMKNFTLGGSFQYEGEEITLLINRKTGQIAFERQGKMVEDPALQNEIMKAFQKVNTLK